MTAVTARPADVPEASPRLGIPGMSAGPSSTDLAALAAVSCGAESGAVTVLDADGARIQTAYGFEEATPPRVDPLCERVMAERRLVVVADAADCSASADGAAGAVRFFAGAPIVTGAGDPLGVLWVADAKPGRALSPHLEQLLVAIANKVAVRAELHGTRLQYESALDLVGAAALRWGADGVLTWVSSSWATVTGHAVEATLGRPLSQFVHGDVGDTIDEVVASARTDSTHRVECILSTVDGAAIPAELVMTGFTAADGGVREVIGVVADLRERQKREIETRHDQKLESLGRLSAGIAHEINTPIQFVGDNTRFLASACQEMLDLLLVYRECINSSSGPASWQERLDRAANAERDADIEYLAAEVPVAVEQSLEGIERVASLVRAMKSFSFKDSHDRSYVDLNEAIRTTLTVARNEVKYVADVTLDLGDLPEVLCRVGDLNQVFLNLLVNAADAMQDRQELGEITITTRAEGPMAVIRIADNGCGIPEHLRQMIFEPFFTTKEIGKGTGQGLALARAVVCEKHGGTIELHSAVGQGTEFVLRIPVDGNRAGSP